MQLLALGWCTSLISYSGKAIVNKNMHAEIVAVKGNSMTRFFPGFSYLPFMCSPCCIFYLALPRLLCLYTANRLFPLFSVDFRVKENDLVGVESAATIRLLTVVCLLRAKTTARVWYLTPPPTQHMSIIFPARIFFSMIQSKSTPRLRRR